MSDEEVTVETSDGQILSAEYKDGQLQIVEVTPFEKSQESQILPDLTEDDSNGTKYMQVLDTSKGLVQLDLLNLTLVRCQNPGESESFQLVANAGTSDGDISSDATVTCVLQSSDTEDPDNQDSYVMVENEDGQGSLVILKSALQQATAVQEPVEPKKTLSPTDLLEKAKSVQKAKALETARGRKRKSELPPAHELLASPGFRLYLYSCKLCAYKCNAVKDMSAHKAREHGGSGRGRSGGGRGAAVTLQCARCPFRAAMHTQLMKHVQDKHMEVATSKASDYTVHLDTEEVAAADVLVCGACGYESASRHAFRHHIEREHGATTC
uniref:C2H2-type domain-containing protein n=1 Tax=Heliothis virescens TaxID=7102 RepID=A0A2A4J4G4_HELVI